MRWTWLREDKTTTIEGCGFASRYQEEEDGDDDDGPDQGGHQARDPPPLDVEEEDEAGERDQDHQDGGDIDEPGPGLARVAPLVEVVHDGDEALVGLGQVVTAGLAVDEG